MFHGIYRITEVIVTKVNGQMIEKHGIVEKLKCALAGEQEGEDPDCNVVLSGQCPSLVTRNPSMIFVSLKLQCIAR